MSHLQVSLMNRLNQTKFAVFKLWMLYFQMILFSDYLELSAAKDTRGGGVKNFYCRQIFTIGEGLD